MVADAPCLAGFLLTRPFHMLTFLVLYLSDYHLRVSVLNLRRNVFLVTARRSDSRSGSLVFITRTDVVTPSEKHSGRLPRSLPAKTSQVLGLHHGATIPKSRLKKRYLSLSRLDFGIIRRPPIPTPLHSTARSSRTSPPHLSQSIRVPISIRLWRVARSPSFYIIRCIATVKYSELLSCATPVATRALLNTHYRV